MAFARRHSGFIAVLAAAILLLWFWILITTSNSVDLDFWHEAALGREASRLGQFVYDDLFAYTPTVSPSVNHEWAAGFAGWVAVSAFGGAGIAVWNLLLAGAALSLASLCAYRGGASAAFTGIAAMAIVPMLAIAFPPVRAQAYSFVFFSSLLLAIERDRSGSRRALFLWLPVFLLWVNVHGSFLIAFGAVGLYFLSRPGWRCAAVLVLMTALTLVNPYGPRLLVHLWHSTRMQRPFIKEWAPLWSAHGNAFRMMLLTLALLATAVWKRRAGLYATVLIAVTAFYGVLHTKFVAYYVLAWLAYVPAWLRGTTVADFVEEPVAANRRAVQVTWAVIVAVSLGGLVAQRFWVLKVPESYPVGAVAYLERERFSGNVMTHFNDGSYVSYMLYPRVRVSMDSRYDVAYPESLVHLSERMYRTGDAGEFLRKFAPDAALVPRGSPLERTLAGSWRRVYRDGSFVVFAKRGKWREVDFGDRRFSARVP